MTRVTIDTARKLEELIGEVVSLVDDTDLVAPNFLATFKCAQRNVMQRYYNNIENKKDKK